MKCYLFADFGSTYTKLTLVDIEKAEIAGTAKARTTVEAGVKEGCLEALNLLHEKVGNYTAMRTFACSSAAGGLKIIAVGLVPELTCEAAKRTALGAGAKIVRTYSGRLSKDEAEEIASSDASIVLLAGGTNGGDTRCILHNAVMLAGCRLKIPVVVAGNEDAAEDIFSIFKGNTEYYKAENVMPKVNKLNTESARAVIRSIFMSKITEAKGMSGVEESIGSVIMPTPAAVLKAAGILAKGAGKEKGLGDLAVVDIGGATTDIHSASEGLPSDKSVYITGLPEPYLKRTVEGDLGMRCSIQTVIGLIGEECFKQYLPIEYKYGIKEEILKRTINTGFISLTNKDKSFDTAVASVCAEIAMKRHAGILNRFYSDNGYIYTQEGKDLTELPFIIGTGGILVSSFEYKTILKRCIFNSSSPCNLMPKNPHFLLDKSYIMPAMGLLAEEEPEIAVKIMKKYLV